MRTLAITLLATVAISAAAAQPEKPPFPALPNPDAWSKLPPRHSPELPEWARVLAGPLPKATAKMLELDYLHREKNPLGRAFAARLRLVVAETLKSPYGIAAAKADLARAAAAERGFLPVPNDIGDGYAVAFARKLTMEGHAITDKEFDVVLEQYGPEQLTAIVHTIAYANFHNRILLGLGVKGESPPFPPVAVKFDAEQFAKVMTPPRPPWDDLKKVTADGPRYRVEWSKHEFEALNKTLEEQKNRKLRMPLPDKSRFASLTGREKEQADTIVWMTVSTGYQLEMTRAWFACLYAFYEEAKVDRVFSNSVFWVVTRTNDCFY
jgi:alkylhydroperoxidase family enzyme